jgi:dihydroorotate dehydrogenase
VLFEKIIRPTLYRWSKGDAELVHERTIRVLSRLGDRAQSSTDTQERTGSKFNGLLSRQTLSLLRGYYGIADPTEVFGLRFPNRLGLAAGMDKDGRASTVWPALGFGFVEVGTVTQHAQPGNPKPRLFTLSESGAIINRMGFNNAGSQALADKLEKLSSGHQNKLPIPLGISIGKSKITPVDEAIDDYRNSLRTLYPYADYFAVNVSSPNTPGLRTLQDKFALSNLLAELQKTAREEAASAKRAAVPLLVKVAPDLSESALEELLEVCDNHNVSGIIATNTTLARDELQGRDVLLGKESGGLSGRPLTQRSREMVRFIHHQTEGKLPIIGVGGISTVDDAKKMLDAGATLLQIYTGFALSGPTLIRRINRGLLKPVQ